jgi:hypothetical protein
MLCFGGFPSVCLSPFLSRGLGSRSRLLKNLERVVNMWLGCQIVGGSPHGTIESQLGPADGR